MSMSLDPREVYQDAKDDFTAADRCIRNHFPGHEMYAVERYLRCLCVLAFDQYRERYRGAAWIAPEEDDRMVGNESKGDG
jgi:hypothetical protein